MNSEVSTFSDISQHFLTDFYLNWATTELR